MTVTITDGTTTVTIDTVQSIRYALRTEAIEVPIPGLKDPMIMSIGGVSRHITIEWVETENISSELKKLADQVMSGEIFKFWNVNIEEWGVQKTGVIMSIEMSQRAGEPTVLVCRVDIVLGEPL